MKLQCTQEIAATPETVFKLISQGSLFSATGILPRSLKIDFRKGGKFSFDWISGGHCEGEFLNIESPMRVSFSWNTSQKTHLPAESGTIVFIELEADGGKTILNLVHEGFQTDESAADHKRGWASTIKDFSADLQFYEKIRDYSWSQFDVIVNVQSTPEKLFQRWATPKGIESFFIQTMEVKNDSGALTDKDRVVEPNDRFTWTWFHGSSVYGRILNVEKNQTIAFTFGESEVNVKFIPHSDGTWLHIRQSQMPETPEAKIRLHVGCRTGWTHYATVLRALEEHGVDIRDKNPKTAGSLSVAFQTSQ